MPLYVEVSHTLEHRPHITLLYRVWKDAVCGNTVYTLVSGKPGVVNPVHDLDTQILNCPSPWDMTPWHRAMINAERELNAALDTIAVPCGAD